MVNLKTLKKFKIEIGLKKELFKNFKENNKFNKQKKIGKKDKKNSINLNKKELSGILNLKVYKKKLEKL